MTTEFKLKCLRSKLSKIDTMNGLLMQVIRAEKLGIPTDLALQARNERAQELQLKKSSFGFRLG